MKSAQEPATKSFVTKGLGNAQYYQGQYAHAEASFREAAQESSGEDRDFALIWLYLSAERNGGKGRAAIAPFVEQTDVERWPGAVVHHLAGRISQDDMLRAARKDKQMERLNLSEAWFYVGQRMLLAGDGRWRAPHVPAHRRHRRAAIPRTRLRAARDQARVGTLTGCCRWRAQRPLTIGRSPRVAGSRDRGSARPRGSA